jgi:hypothetical protein
MVDQPDRLRLRFSGELKVKSKVKRKVLPRIYDPARRGLPGARAVME